MKLMTQDSQPTTDNEAQVLLLLLMNLDLRGDVILSLLDELNRHVRAGHRRQAGDALVCTDHLGVFGIAELHLRAWGGADRNRLGVRIHLQELSLCDARLLSPRLLTPRLLTPGRDRSDHQQNRRENEKRTLTCSHV